MADPPGAAGENLMVRGNLHTHTYRCGHATGEVDDYCRLASQEGLEYLGISDHTPLPDGRWPNVRMRLDELPGYCRAIKTAQKEFPNLAIIKGMECEYFPRYHDFFLDHLVGKSACEYLIGAVHFFPHQGNLISVFGGITTRETLRSYTQHCITTMESGLFAFMAHPDVFANSYIEWDETAADCSREIFNTAEKMNLPLEINTYGYYKPQVETTKGPRPAYPWTPFWKLAHEYSIEVVINSDAHRPELVLGKMNQGLSLALDLGLTIVEPLTPKST